MPVNQVTQVIQDWVDEKLIRAAIADAGVDATLGSANQWASVTEYVNNRGDDPWPARRIRLAAGEVPVAELQEWLAQDVRVAAPLMGAFTSHDTSIVHAAVPVPSAEIAAVAAWLAQHQGSQIRVAGAEVIGGGFSRLMWRVNLVIDGVQTPAIVRIEQGGMFGTDTVTEVHAMRALHAVGHAVPEVLAVEKTGTLLGQPFFIMEAVPGAVRLDDQGLDDIITSVADLHAVPVSVLSDSDQSAENVMHNNIEYWRAMYRKYAPESPLVEHGAEWLHEHLHPTGPSVIVHGDAGPGNALFDSARGLTTIDWEFAHIGDPAEDWAYLALIRGRRIMDADAWKARLAKVAGIEYSPEQWQQWLAFNHYRGACVNLSAKSVFERGPRRTSDHLSIGVAVHLRFLSQLTEITCA
jgi:aminoglycoside phosphotransferase (APT) family kinase protein